jgi:hypothetical protein
MFFAAPTSRIPAADAMVPFKEMLPYQCLRALHATNKKQKKKK